MDQEMLRNPLLIAGMALALGLKAFDMVKTGRHRRSMMNGDNPVVSAIGTLRDAMEREQRLTREKLVDCHQATDRRLEEHERREERQWESVDRKLEVRRVQP